MTCGELWFSVFQRFKRLPRGYAWWLGTLGPEAPILDRHESACELGLGCVRYYIRLCALLCQVPYYIWLLALSCQVACTEILGACAIKLIVPHQCMRQYIVTSLKRFGQVAGALRDEDTDIRPVRQSVSVRHHSINYVFRF